MPFCSLSATFLNAEAHYADLTNVAVPVYCPGVMMTVSELKHCLAADKSEKKRQRQVVCNACSAYYQSLQIVETGIMINEKKDRWQMQNILHQKGKVK